MEEMRQEKVRKISTTGDTYIEEMEGLRDYSSGEAEVFGGDVIELHRLLSTKKILRDRGDNEISEEDIRRTQQRLEQAAIENLRVFKKSSKMFGGLLFGPETSDLLRWASSDSSVVKRADVLIREIQDKRAHRQGKGSPKQHGIQKGKEEEGLARLIRENKMPVDLWVSILRAYKDIIVKYQETFQEEVVPMLIAEMKKQLPTFLAQFGIRDPGSIVERLEQVTFNVVDPLTASLERIGGSYEADFARVHISAGLMRKYDRKPLKHTFVHEACHVMSGKLVYNQETKFSGDEEETEEPDVYNQIAHGRIGLQYGTAFDKEYVRVKERFRWLNEAVTEMLALRFLQMEESSEIASYSEERKILTFLMTRGSKEIPLELFVRAYFEDYEPKEEADKQELSSASETIPHWRTLRRAINEGFGPEFLVKLDKQIRKEGPAKVASDMSNGTFPLK